MVFKKSGFTRITLSIVFIAVLAGCSGDIKQDAINPGESKGTAIEQPKQPVELVFYSSNGDSEESFNVRFGDAIRKKFPDYTIKYIRRYMGSSELQHLIASSTKIDIYFDSIGNYESQMFDNGLQVDMTDLIRKHNLDLTRFEPSIIEAMKQISDGKMYGLPVFNNSTNLYYNKSIFDKFGIPYPKDGMTWDDLLELSKKMNRMDEGKQYYGFSSSPNHILRMNQLSIPNVDLTTDTPTINKDERWKQFFEAVFIKPAEDPGYKDNKKLPPISYFIKDQTLAMYTFLSSMPLILPNEMKALDWDMVSLPTFKSMPGIGSQAYPSYFGITKFTENRDAAMEVLKYLTSEQFQMELSRQGIMTVLNNPSIKSSLGQDSPFKGKNYKAVYYNQFAPIAPRAKYDVQLVANYSALIGFRFHGHD
ncbi:ABC transporter substrate-binding protein [Paenibacillus sp. UNC451MF]|uniref:ABC transporter substrate-binding protein n=1 Tax=Paenibacillus sp. UNC451MF TaxID=1449063 RepID=UPI0004920BD2|nr:extracellular solute-binding protein [Paenibacillus sp. UNC451MF]